MSDVYWSICQDSRERGVEWYESKTGYSEDWTRNWERRLRFGSRAEAMSVLWDIRNRRGGRVRLVKVARRKP